MKQSRKICTQAATSFITLGLFALLTSCAMLSTKATSQLSTYTLNGEATAMADSTPQVMSGPVLLVEVPHAAPGYDSARMVYVRHPLTQEVYANSVWIDTPARMLAPMLVAHVQKSLQFRAVLSAPSSGKASLRLDTTILRLQQNFLQVPSTVQLSMRVTLMDNATRDVLASRTLNVVQSASSDDAFGGAQAAQSAVQEGLRQVEDFLQAAMAGRSAGTSSRI
jgi:cholesterol transport system auxiliary component